MIFENFNLVFQYLRRFSLFDDVHRVETQIESVIGQHWIICNTSITLFNFEFLQFFLLFFSLIFLVGCRISFEANHVLYIILLFFLKSLVEMIHVFFDLAAIKFFLIITLKAVVILWLGPFLKFLLDSLVQSNLIDIKPFFLIWINFEHRDPHSKEYLLFGVHFDCVLLQWFINILRQVNFRVAYFFEGVVVYIFTLILFYHNFCKILSIFLLIIGHFSKFDVSGKWYCWDLLIKNHYTMCQYAWIFTHKSRLPCQEIVVHGLCSHV